MFNLGLHAILVSVAKYLIAFNFLRMLHSPTVCLPYCQAKCMVTRTDRYYIQTAIPFVPESEINYKTEYIAHVEKDWVSAVKCQGLREIKNEVTNTSHCNLSGLV